MEQPRLGEPRDAVDRGRERRVGVEVDGLGRHDAVDVDEAGQTGPRGEVQDLDVGRGLAERRGGEPVLHGQRRLLDDAIGRVGRQVGIRLDQEAKIDGGRPGADRAGPRHVEEVAVRGAGPEGGEEAVAPHVLRRRAGHQREAREPVRPARSHGLHRPTHDARVGDAPARRLDPGLDDVLDGHDARGLARAGDLERRPRDQRVPAHEIQDLVPVDLEYPVPPLGRPAKADVLDGIGGELKTHRRAPEPRPAGRTAWAR